jgi:hypothetical protein
MSGALDLCAKDCARRSEDANSGAIVISAQWRQRLTYLLMSLVVAWHSLAMMISPAPNDSTLVQSLRSVFHPYLELFRLETPWGFFAPVGKHAQFRYVIEDASGHTQTFIPAEEPSPSLARYALWREFKYLLDGVMANPEFRGDPAGVRFCREHADLHPVAVTLLEIVEQDYRPQDEILGKRPLDPQFVAVVPLRRVACPDSPAPPANSGISLAHPPS